MTPPTGHRVKSRYVDAETGRPVAEKDEVKDYETEVDTHILIEEEKLEAVGLESTRTINVGQWGCSGDSPGVSGNLIQLPLPWASPAKRRVVRER